MNKQYDSLGDVVTITASARELYENGYRALLPDYVRRQMDETAAFERLSPAEKMQKIREGENSDLLDEIRDIMR